MAANPTPTNDDQLLVRCFDLLAGLVTHEKKVGIKHSTAKKMQAAIEIAKATRDEAARLKQERTDCRADLRGMDREGEIVLSRCRLRLVMLLGGGYSSAWEATGFPNRSTMVPEVFAERLALLKSLADYFEANPGHQSNDMGATAEICRATHKVLATDRSSTTAVQDHLRVAVQAKSVAFKVLRKLMRGLIRELDMLLAPDDIRWRAFGLNVPAHRPPPEAIRDITLSVVTVGEVKVGWSASPGATHYEVQSRVVGTESFLPAPRVEGLSTILQDLPVGQKLEIRVIAISAQKIESAPSPIEVIDVG